MSDFEASFLNHDAWLGQAEQFAHAAEALISSIEPLRGTRTEEANSKMVGCIRGALLLLAISVENSLKAVKVAQKQVKVEAGKVDRTSLGGGRSGHQLQQLAAEATFSLSEPESLLLKRLTEVVIWAGRYQQPLSEQEYKNASIDNPRRLAPMSDLRLVHQILARARKQCLVATRDA
jgi:hypothetical protein